jgi:hypothetical protein
MIINVSKIWSTRDLQEWLTLSATVTFTFLSLLQLFFISRIQLVGIEAFIGHEASYPLFYAKEILESGSLYPDNFSGREIAPVSWPIFNAFLLALGFTVSASTLGISAFCFTIVLLVCGFVFSRQFTRSKLIISATLCLLLHSNPYPFQLYSWFDQVFIWPMNSYGVYDVLSIIVLSMSFLAFDEKGGDKTKWSFLFLLITFLVSLNGTRAIVLIVIPAIFSIFYLNYTQYKLELKKYRKDSLILFLTFLSMLTGMILTKIVVGQYPQPWQEGHSIISIPSSRELIERASLFYDHFVENVGVSIPPFSKFYSLEFLAFLSNLVLFSLLTFFVVTVPLDQLDNRSALTVLHHRFIFAVLLISIVFGSGWKESRYLIPFFYCLLFAAPIYLVNICEKASGLAKLFVFSCLFLSCVANTHYLNQTFQKRNLV